MGHSVCKTIGGFKFVHKQVYVRKTLAADFALIFGAVGECYFMICACEINET